MGNVKTCFDCRYRDGWTCMYRYAARAIRDEEKSAKDCEYYSKGEFKNTDENLMGTFK